MSMLELFHRETQAQVQVLSSGMLVLERDPSAVEQLDICARAARSLKAVARVAGLQASADLALAMEDCFAAARQDASGLHSEQIGLMLCSLDLLEDIARLLYAFCGTDKLASVRGPAEALLPGDSEEIEEIQAPEYRALAHRKRVLIVDDSLSVREFARSLLACRGYDVQTAADGVDGWNAVRTGEFDLVVTDLDMPLVDGIRLVRLVRNDPRLVGLPVVIVCEREGETDRRCAFEAGADYYMLKENLHDTLTQAVASLIGAAQD